MSSATTGDRNAWFATTQWSVVLCAGRADGAGSREALEKLCERYWLPLYSYVRRRGYAPDDAGDLTQEFFVRLLDNNRIARADRDRGRFRSFLLISLKNFLSDDWDRKRALKRGGGTQIVSFQFETGEALYELEPAHNVTPEQIFERRWALTLLDNVLTRLRDEHEVENKTDLFQSLSSCLVGERTSQPYAALAEKLGMSESGIKSAVHRLRRRYRELLRREIANTVATPDEIDDELRYLFEVLSRR